MSHQYLRKGASELELINAINDLIRLIKDYQESDGDPNGSITPEDIGEWCLDTTNNAWYRATGTTNADWQAL